MPQEYDQPEDSGLQRGDQLPPRKKKKPTKTRLPATETSAAPAQQQAAGPTAVRELHHDMTLKAAASTTRAIRQETRQYLKGEQVKPAVRQDVLSSISNRASLLSPALLANNPSLAAELLLGETKTRDLKEVSAAAYEGWTDQMRARAKAEAEADVRQQFYADPEGWRIGTAIARDPVLLEYSQKGDKLPEGESKDVFMAGIVAVSQMPDGPRRDNVLANLSQAYEFAADGNLAYETSPLQDVTALAGRGLSFAWNVTYGKYIWLASHAVDFAQEHGPEVLDDPLQKTQDAFGSTLRGAETGVQFVTRNIEGAVVAFAQRGNTQVGADDLWTTWDEVEEGGHSPVSHAIAATMGTTADDPKWQGLFGGVDLAADLGVQIFLFKRLTDIKTAIRSTQSGGGSFSGEAFVNSRLLGGTRVVNTAWEIIRAAKNPDAAAIALVGKFKKGMTPTLARTVAQATTRDQAARLIAHGLDDVATVEVTRLQASLNAVNDELKVEAETAPTTARAASTTARVPIDELEAVLRETDEYVPLRERAITGADDITALRESLVREGQVEPITLSRRGDAVYLEDGAHRIQALREEGITEVTVSMKAGHELPSQWQSTTLPRPVTFEEWRDARNRGDTDTTIMVDRQWLAENAKNPTPRDMAAVERNGLETAFPEIRADLQAGRWDPSRPVQIVMEADGTYTIFDATHRLGLYDLQGGTGKIPVEFIGSLDHNVMFDRLKADLPAESLMTEGITEGSRVRTEVLTAERAALEQRITELTNNEVVHEFPRISHVRPFMRGIGFNSWTGRMLKGIFGEAGARDISKWTNDLTPDDMRLIEPGKTANWASHNIDVTRKLMNVVRVPKDVQNSVFEMMFAVERGQVSFFEWRKYINEAFRTGKRYNPEIERALRISEASIEARTHSPVERRYGPNPRDTALENAALDEFGNPLPTRPTQLLGDSVRLPDMRVLEDATSTVARFDLWAKDKPVIGKLGHGLRASTQWANLVMLEIPRLVLRPGLLVSQLPRLFTKIEFDQSLRAYIAEHITPADWFDGRVKSFLKREKTELDPTTGAPLHIGAKERLTPEGTTKPDMSGIGVVASEVLSEVTSVSSKMSTAGLEFRPKDLDLATTSIHRHLEELAADPIAVRVARDGPEATRAWLESHPDHWAARKMLDEVMPNLEAKGYTLESVLADMKVEIDQAVGGDAALRRAIATKKWDGYKDVPTKAARDRQLVADELAEARNTLARTENPIMRREINLRIEALERRDLWLAGRRQTQKTVDLSDGKTVQAQIAENWRNGAYDMPNEVVVRRPTIKSETTPTTRLERTRAQAGRLNRLLYKGFKPASAVTWNMSRGSTFRKVAERIEARLLERGYSLEAARYHANARAVFITKDLHYDISARSSMDRKLQNYFWFSPVWREQLAVYLHKIPQKAFWAPGIALEWSMASTFIQGLKDMGVVQDRVVFTDPETGEETMHPFFTLPGGAQLDVGGLNPITPATEEVGQLPTLSPGAEMILDFTATHLDGDMRKFAEGIAQYFTFDGDVEHGVNIIPRTLTVIPEWFGLHIPSETFTNWVDYDNKVDLQVKKLAMSQLAEDGVLPPTQGAFANEHSYDLALNAYRDRVAAAAKDIEKGVFGIHLIGRILTPGTVRSAGTDLYAEDSAANAFYDWRNTLDPNLTTEEYYAAVNKRVRAHPEEFPYSVGSHDYAGPRQGDWYETEAYRNSPLLDDDAYVDKALGQVHYWSADEPAPELSDTATAELLANDPKAFNKLSPRRKARLVAEWTTLDVGEMTEVQASAVGLPKFYGRDAFLRDVDAINAQYEAQYNYDKGETYNELLANHRDFLLEKEAKSHGKAGEAILRYTRSTPAQRLNHAGHFSGPEANTIIARAGAVARATVKQGYAITGTGGSYDDDNVLELKASLFAAVDRMRQESPEFDRQMRYAELGLGKNDTPLGRVAAYQLLFFGESFYDSDKARDVVEEMTRARYS